MDDEDLKAAYCPEEMDTTRSTLSWLRFGPAEEPGPVGRMLEAGHRAAYADLLAPPPGRRLERAVGLTYSLDLTTLADSLRAFAGTDDPARLLDLADKVTVYCQAGRLRPGAAPADFHGLLDKSVRAVAPPEGGFFHPKLWLLKFAGPGPAAPGYRLIVGSLNASETEIYFEIGAALEGDLVTDSAVKNGELTAFLRSSCPGLEGLDGLCAELSRVSFAPPPGFSGWRFESQRGLPHPERLLARLQERRFEKLAIVSPALAGEALELLLAEAAPQTAPILVSTKASLDALGPELLERFEAYVVRDRGAGVDGPAGLHAKILVGERGGRTEVWVGSANAAKGGWLGSNTECMAALEADGCTLDRFKENFIRGPWIAPYRRGPDHSEGRELKERNRRIERHIGYLTRAAWSAEFVGGRAELRFETAEKEDLLPARSASVGLLGHRARIPLDELRKAGKISLALDDAKAPTEFLTVELDLENPARAVKFLVQARSRFDKRAREKSYFLR